MPDIVRCHSCDGYGWYDDPFTGEVNDCDWCDGVGYIYRIDGIDKKIPKADYGRIADQLEQLEKARMQALGYTGDAKHPKDQAIRKQNGD